MHTLCILLSVFFAAFGLLLLAGSGPLSFPVLSWMASLGMLRLRVLLIARQQRLADVQAEREYQERKKAREEEERTRKAAIEAAKPKPMTLEEQAAQVDADIDGRIRILEARTMPPEDKQALINDLEDERTVRLRRLVT